MTRSEAIDEAVRRFRRRDVLYDILKDREEHHIRPAALEVQWENTVATIREEYVRLMDEWHSIATQSDLDAIDGQRVLFKSEGDGGWPALAGHYNRYADRVDLERGPFAPDLMGGPWALRSGIKSPTHWRPA